MGLHLLSPFDLSRILPGGGSLLVSRSLTGPPVVKITHASGYYLVWPGWVVSVSGSPNNFPSTLSMLLAETPATPPCKKRQINWRKKNTTNRSLITCIRPVYKRDTQENWKTPWNGPCHHLKYHLQLNTKEDVEGEDGASYGRFRGKAW